jgi:hypothetical protein
MGLTAFGEGRRCTSFGDSREVFCERHGFDIAASGEPDDNEEVSASAFSKFFEFGEVSF